MNNLTLVWAVVAGSCVLGAIGGYRLGMDSVAVAGEAAQGESPAPKAAGTGPRRAEPNPARPRLEARELGRQMVEAIRIGDRQAWAATEEQIRDFRKEGLRLVLAELDGLATVRQRSEAMMPVLLRLAQIDPPLALEEAGRHLTGMELPRARGMVLREWALSNPATALEQARALENELAEGIDYVSSVFRAWGGADFDRALSHVSALDDRAEVQRAVGALASAAGSSAERQTRLLEISQAFDAPALRREFLERGVRSWAQNANRDEIATWIESKEFEAPVRAELLRAVAEGAAIRDPQRTAAWLMEQSTPDSWAADLETVVSAWAYSQPEACGEWLAGKVQGPEADRAVAGYSNVMARRNPVEAVSWALRIHGGELRESTLDSIVRAMGPVPVEAVREQLERAGLPEDLVGQLLEKRSGPRRLEERAVDGRAEISGR